MKSFLYTLLALGILTLPALAEEGAHRIGGGANYWVTIDDIDVDDIDDDGFSYFVSYQYKPNLIGLGIDVEALPDRFGEDTYAPQAYLFIGSGVYAGAGIGVLYADSEFADDPFFSFRAGVNLELIPGLLIDIFAQYRFESEEDLDDDATDIDTDTVFLGGAVRIAL